MQLTDEQVKELYQRYLINLCSEEELRLMVSILSGEEPDFPEQKVTALFDQTWAGLQAAPGYYPMRDLVLPEQTGAASSHRIGHRHWWWAAASLLCISLAAAWFVLKQEKLTNGNNTAVTDQPVLPGTNGAILTLADGSVITLDSTAGNQQLVQSKTNASLQNGSISYKQIENDTNPRINILSTPKGKQFRIELSDGTAVWLNAASSLRYPAVFTGNDRVVELDGEAYFEVAKAFSSSQKALPFKVAVAAQHGRPSQTIEVLGTHFNVNSYADEPLSKTTLLEGSIRVNDQLLTPGQQYQAGANIRQVVQADMEEAVSWKSGYFKFNEESIDMVMRKIERWYNVKVIYEGAIPADKFNGTISRARNLEDMIDLLQATKVVHLTVQGNTIIVKK